MFVKGQSGNPSGRPLSPEHRDFIAWCKEAAVKKVKKRIEELLESNNRDYQMWASQVILERAFGRPVQVNQNENYDMNEAKALTDLELKQKAMEFLKSEPNPRNDSQGTGIPPVQ